jgi:CheY-like chemotaxis protein
MVVEDEVLLRMMIADELRHSDLQVIECGNADEALDVLHSGTPVSAVLTDLRMPGSLDGVKLAKAVHDEFPDMRVFLTSSCAPPLMMRRTKDSSKIRMIRAWWCARSNRRCVSAPTAYRCSRMEIRREDENAPWMLLAENNVIKRMDLAKYLRLWLQGRGSHQRA